MHILTHATVYNIHTDRRANTKTYTCTQNYIHTDQQHNYTHSHTPRTTAQAQAHIKMCSETFTHFCNKLAHSSRSSQSKAHPYFVHTLVYSETIGDCRSGTLTHTVFLTHPCRHPQFSSQLGSALSPHPLPTTLWGLWDLPPELGEGRGGAHPTDVATHSPAAWPHPQREKA